MATEKELKLVQLLRKLNSVQNIILSRIAETKNGDINYDDYDYVDNLCEDLLSTLNFESDPEVLQGLELETSHIEFTNSDLMRIFKSRLKTQDRISNTGCKMLYPINYIRALYNQEGKQDELRKILEEIIKDITFHVKESEESVEIKGIKFPEIKSLHIDPNEKIVRVYSDNKWYILWDPENRGKIEATAMR